MRRLVTGLAARALSLATGAALAQDFRIALLVGRTGPLEAYAKQTETGFLLGLEYLTKGTMRVGDRRIEVLVKDDQGKPDLAKSLLEQAYQDDKVALAVGTSSSGATLAMLPVAEENKRILIVEPAAADSITGEKWNRYVFRTARNSTVEALSTAIALGDDVSIGILAQDYAYGRDGAAALRTALAATKRNAPVVVEEFAPPTTIDFTAPVQRLFDALKARPGRKAIVILWAGPHPLPRIAEMRPERFGIELVPGGNSLEAMRPFRAYPGLEGAINYYWAFPNNPMNDWLVAEHRRRFGAPPNLLTGPGMAAAAAVVTALGRAGSADPEALIAAMEGMEFDTPKGPMTFRREDHQALQAMYHFRVKPDGRDEHDLLALVREIPAADMPIPVRNGR